MLNTVGPILIGMRPPIETHFLQAPSALAKISSTRVREVAQHGGAGSLEGLCPKRIEFMVLEMYGGAGHDNGNDAARGEGKSKRIRKVA